MTRFGERIGRLTVAYLIFVLTLTRLSFADGTQELDSPSPEQESAQEAESPEPQERDGPGERLDPGFRNFGRALGYNFTKGLFAKDNIRPLVIGSLATLAMFPLDDEVSDYFQGRSEELGDAGQFIGLAGVVAVTGGVLLATPFVENERYRAFSFTLAQSMLLNHALLYSLKFAVSRTRPNEENDHSFPSGHTSSTFTAAAVVNHYYGKKWGVPLYIVAGLVGLSRIEKGKHFPSDVVFGATLGYLSARSAIRGTEHYAQEREWTLTPSLGRRHAALYFRLEF